MILNRKHRLAFLEALMLSGPPRQTCDLCDGKRLINVMIFPVPAVVTVTCPECDGLGFHYILSTQ